MQFIVRGISQELADEVRRTRRAPDYGHPAHLELAQNGTGPCRCCLEPFVIRQEERLLLTYRPPGDAAEVAGARAGVHPRARLQGLTRVRDFPTV